jgi:hypothetical protein
MYSTFVRMRYIPRVTFSYKAEKLIESVRLLHQCRPDAKGVSTD